MKPNSYVNGTPENAVEQFSRNCSRFGGRVFSFYPQSDWLGQKHTFSALIGYVLLLRFFFLFFFSKLFCHYYYATTDFHLKEIMVFEF